MTLARLLSTGGLLLGACLHAQEAAVTGEKPLASSPPFVAIAPNPARELAEEYYSRGLMLRQSNDPKGAQEEFARALQTDPTNAQIVRRVCMMRIQQADSDGAIRIIREYLDHGGDHAVGYELEGELLLSKKFFDSAFEALTRSATMSPRNARVHELLGLIHVSRRKTVDALSELRLASEQDPRNPQIRYWFGRVLYSNANYEGAREQFLECLRLQPDYPKARENLGLSYEAGGDNDNALSTYTQAMEEESRAGRKRTEPFIYFGVFLAGQDERERALKALREAVDINPLSFRANFELGRLLLKLDDIAPAETYLKTAERLYPQYSRTHFLLSRIYQKQNRPQDARRKLEEFRTLDAEPANREFPETAAANAGRL